MRPQRLANLYGESQAGGAAGERLLCLWVQSWIVDGCVGCIDGSVAPTACSGCRGCNYLIACVCGPLGLHCLLHLFTWRLHMCVQYQFGFVWSPPEDADLMRMTWHDTRCSYIRSVFLGRGCCVGNANAVCLQGNESSRYWL